MHLLGTWKSTRMEGQEEASNIMLEGRIKEPIVERQSYGQQ